MKHVFVVGQKIFYLHNRIPYFLVSYWVCNELTSSFQYTPRLWASPIFVTANLVAYGKGTMVPDLLCTTFQQELWYVVHTYSVAHPVAQATQAVCSGNGSTSKTLARVAKREVSFDVDLSHVCSQAALRIGKRPPS